MNKRKLLNLHQIILSRNTGKPEDIAKNLRMSRATFFRYKNWLTDLGAEVLWIPLWNTYIYENDFDIVSNGREVHVRRKDGTISARKFMNNRN